MSVFVFGSLHHHLNHDIFQRELVNCPLEIFDWEKEPVTENSLLLADLCWFNQHQLTEFQIESAKRVQNKRILLIFDYKSIVSDDTMQIIQDIKNYLDQMNFKQPDVYIITQLEHDIQLIKKVMPDVNVVCRDRWLKELFQVQVTPYAFSEDKDINLDLSGIPNKRFSLFIRRYEQVRFEFLCSLLALGLENHLHYTFANTDSDMTNDQFKELIPDRLSHARHILDPWVEGIPYAIQPSKNYDHPHYPLNLKYYCQKSDINIVLETHPYAENKNEYISYLTEKTYKAILFKKPFILVSLQHTLKSLRQSGFKTFSPWIDESYDDIEDFDLRIEAVLAEIKRLSALPNEEMAKILQEINEIIEHNYKVLYDLAYTPFPEEYKLKSLLNFSKSDNA